MVKLCSTWWLTLPCRCTRSFGSLAPRLSEPAYWPTPLWPLLHVCSGSIAWPIFCTCHSHSLRNRGRLWHRESAMCAGRNCRACWSLTIWVFLLLTPVLGPVPAKLRSVYRSWISPPRPSTSWSLSPPNGPMPGMVWSRWQSSSASAISITCWS